MADGLATEVLLPETEGEKEGGREEIWRRKEAELSAPHFSFSPLFFLSPLLLSAPPFTLYFFYVFLLWLMERKWKVRGEQEVKCFH